jgi:hypothetical protein
MGNSGVSPAREEIGRELQVHELQPNTIVWTNPEHRPQVYASVWVFAVDDEMVALLAAVQHPPALIGLGFFRRSDGTLADGEGHRIRLFEYLGAA